MESIRKVCLAISAAALLLLIVGLALRSSPLWQPAAVVASVALAIGLGAVPVLRGYQFTAWIIAATTAAMIYPASLLHVGPVDLKNPWIMMFAIQAVMFGMGTQMSLADFAGVARMPWAVFVGVFCQFTIMPLVGYTLATTFDLPDEVAAGIVLIGSCSSGLASNVMTFLARANLPLSITLTSVTTLLAPIVTPTWMKLLAGAMVEVSFLKMMIEIIQMVLVPIGAALLHDYLKHASPRGKRVVFGLAALGVAWLAYLALGGWYTISASVSPTALPWIGLIGFLLGAVVAGVVYHALTLKLPALDSWMPLIAMMGIIYVVGVITAAGRDNLLAVGGVLFVAVAIHNAVGYCLGYWMARAMGLDRQSARTVAIEVGMQNGGMAAGLASAMGKSGTVGLAAALFAAWMNVTASILANYWRRRPVDGSPQGANEPDAPARA
jgi:bile acid:Na+ symporter, BASS family